MKPDRAQKPAFDRVLPQNIEAERSTLGAMLLNPDALPRVMGVVGDIGPEVFYVFEHRKVYAAMLECEEARKPVDEITVTEQLREDGELETVGGVSYIADLTNAVPTSANAEYYAAIVRDCWRARETMRLGSLLHDTAAAPGEDDNVATLTDRLVALRAVDAGPQTTRIGDGAQAVADNLRAIAEGRISPGYGTGWRCIDYLLSGGIQNGQFIVVCGRQTQGKTTFAFNIAFNAARLDKTAVLFFSLEMDRQQIIEKLFQIQTGINIQAIRTRKAADWELDKLDQAVRAAQELEIHIDDHPHRGVNHIRARATEFKRDHPRSIVIIDYLQLMEGDRRAESRQIAVSGISRALKNLAAESEIPIIVLSQLNRESEAVPDLYNKFNYQRECGALEQDPDVGIVIAPATEGEKALAIKSGKPISDGFRYVCVAKHRGGPVGIEPFLFDLARQRFSPVDDRDHEPEQSYVKQEREYRDTSGEQQEKLF